MNVPKPWYSFFKNSPEYMKRKQEDQKAMIFNNTLIKRSLRDNRTNIELYRYLIDPWDPVRIYNNSDFT